MAAYLSLADVLLIHLKKSPDVAITIPSKTYSYLATGKPIIAGTEGDVAELIKRTDCGMVFPPEDPEALADTVRQMAQVPPERREEMGNKGRQSFQANFTRQVLAERYEKLFQRTIQNFNG
jgi:glycosyltransferase involved in cell wall biosynthesis